MIGKIVTVIVDRPINSQHPIYPNIVYPINYGFIPNTLAKDGEEQDAYILGVNVPIATFKGKIVAVIHRKNDIETKFVVAPETLTPTREEIFKAVHFQEQYFNIEIEM